MMRLIRHTVSSAVALCTLFAGAAHAQFTNGGFETGSFTGWQTTGDTAVVGPLGSINPDTGAFQARITSEPGSVPPSAVETFLGLNPGAIDTLISGLSTEGSAIKQTLTVNVGDTLTFRYNMLTDEFTPDATYNDTVFFCVVGPGATLVKVADTFTTPYTAATGTIYFEQTGYRTFTHTFTAAGTVTVGIGIVDMGDGIVNSAVLIDGPGGPPPPAAGVTVTQSGGATAVTEGGATDTYTVRLNSAPTANVMIAVNAGTQVNVTPASLTFTTTNWNTPQTVTVTAVDDAAIEGAHSGTITHAATSTDTAYSGVTISSVTVTITDNDSGPPTPPPAAPPPPPPPPPNEGTIGGSFGSGGANEGTFGFGFQMLGAARGTAATPRPRLRGPLNNADGTYGVINRSNRNSQPRDSSAANASNAATPGALSLAVVLTLAAAGVVVWRGQPTA